MLLNNSQSGLSVSHRVCGLIPNSCCPLVKMFVSRTLNPNEIAFIPQWVSDHCGHEDLKSMSLWMKAMNVMQLNN